MIDLLRAIADNPQEISRFLGTTTGATPINEYFAPQNMERLLRTNAESIAA
jgi:hypothetical protein